MNIMRICIIAEGSYPYITGGVSSWIHSLTSQLSEHEFIIYSIGAQSKNRGKFKYQLPANIIEVKEVFLDAYLDETGEWGSRFRISKQEEEILSSLISGRATVDWGGFFDLIRSRQFHHTADFLSSKNYFDMVEEICRTEYELVPFTEMFWTIRSMILPLFLTIRNEVPEADIYHSVSTGYAGVIGTLAKHLYGKPLILTEHGIYSREREEEIIKADWVKGYFKDLWINYFYTLSSSIYEAADQVVTLFNRNKEIEMELGCDGSKIAIIPNGVHIDSGYTNNQNSDEQTIRIGAVVRVVPIKDIKTMIQSFALIKREVPNATLTIMGPTEEDDTYFQECLQMVESLQVKDIEFTGEVKVKDYLGHMDILLLSSISEGQPLAVLEGMASGKPFVSTNVGSCKELLYGVDDGIGPAGFVVPVMHYEFMAQRVIELCRSRELREEMGRNALQRVTLHYQHHDFIENYRNLYASLKEVRYGRHRV